MISSQAPSGRKAITRFLLDDLPSLGPAPRGIEGFERSCRFFGRLGDPQDAARQVHVVGTAGKGTAAAAIIGRLVGAGARVGAHLSPHVYDLRERFLLDGDLPTWAQVEQSMAAVWPAVVDTELLEGRPPSFFELTTALAWTIGATAQVDHLVTEAGIGGAVDATNAITRADKVTVIMPIGYDHMEILGQDLAGIARTKAAVIPAGGQVAVAPQPYAEALAVIEAVAAERGAHIHHVDPAVADASRGARPAWRVQADAVADVVMRLLASGNRLDVDAAAHDVDLPGRLEELDAGGRVFLFDGAHNPLKLAAVASGLAEPVDVVVAALSHEKELEDCARELARLGDCIITTDFAVAAGDRVVRRSWSAQQLADAIHDHRPAASIVPVPDVEAAMLEAVRSTSRGSRILVTGSFMMLAPARAAVLSPVPA